MSSRDTSLCALKLSRLPNISQTGIPPTCWPDRSGVYPTPVGAGSASGWSAQPPVEVCIKDPGESAQPRGVCIQGGLPRGVCIQEGSVEPPWVCIQGGGSAQLQGVCPSQGDLPRGVCIIQGGSAQSPPGLPTGGGFGQTPPVHRMTHRCKNITLSQTLLAGR